MPVYTSTFQVFPKQFTHPPPPNGGPHKIFVRGGGGASQKRPPKRKQTCEEKPNTESVGKWPPHGEIGNGVLRGGGKGPCPS